jgi:hypothetical protein
VRVKKVRYRPGWAVCKGCNDLVEYDHMNIIEREGRLSDLRRCDVCTWSWLVRNGNMKIPTDSLGPAGQQQRLFPGDTDTPTTIESRNRK